MSSRLTRREFVSSAASAAALSTLPLPRALSSDQVALSSAPPWSEQGILNLAHSPHAKLQNIPVHAVTLHEGFWQSRRTANVQSSIPSMGKLLESNGRMDNFRRLTNKSDAPQRGPVYSDSDMYKWLEAVGFTLQTADNQELHKQAAQVIHDIVAAQESSGYLNTYFVQSRAADRMTPKTQQWGHELYCIGHLLQGATSYYRATGDRTLLDSGIHFVNDFLIPSYGPNAKQVPILSGHPEIEMALVELYRMTGDRRHLMLAEYILHGDSRITLKPSEYTYHFCGKPFTARTHLEGHAVRAMYACCGATDYYLETGDELYWKTLWSLWNDLVFHQMYITGGVGARSDGEAFGDSYELPNAQAYGESCAAIGNMMWNWRMLAATADARYGDVIERALYNGINSGMSLDGTLYCYRNPLAFDPDSGETIRNPWYDTTCCPPNLERTFASLPGYFYSTAPDGIYVHLFHNSALDWHLQDGTPVKITQHTDYPWKGTVDIEVSPSSSAEFAVYVRNPGWSKTGRAVSPKLNIQLVSDGGYIRFHQRWQKGDTIHLEFDMSPQLLASNSHVVENTNRVAVQRGPLVYCLEQLDQPEGIHLADVAIPATAVQQPAFAESFDKNLLDGITVLHLDGANLQTPDSQHTLYFPAPSSPTKSAKVPLTFIPYYAWANRTPTQMQVWTPLLRS
ncbi:MAG TPA: beta-L-arabinofuranosidase domain-containing protein [Dongiaceae bacterium]|nr:beta-L-arabinofuranosidase domain-containing protein [Dongiaceae bacterium]